VDNGPLVREEIEAGEELARAFHLYQPLKAAFWLRAGDEEQRYLYLASDGIDDTNFDIAYGEILRLVRKIDSPDLDPFRVRVIGGDNALAIDAAEINTRYPDRVPRRSGSQMFGGLYVEDLYIYPPLPEMARA